MSPKNAGDYTETDREIWKYRVIALATEMGHEMTEASTIGPHSEHRKKCRKCNYTYPLPSSDLIVECCGGRITGYYDDHNIQPPPDEPWWVERMKEVEDDDDTEDDPETVTWSVSASQTVYSIRYFTFEVEAESEDEAVEVAKQMINDGDVDCDNEEVDDIGSPEVDVEES